MGTRLELEVWREAGRHIDIQESLPRIARAIGVELPVDGVALHRLDTESQRLRAIGIAASDGAVPPHATSVALRPDELRALESLLRRGIEGASVSGTLASLLSSGLGEHAVVVTLDESTCAAFVSAAPLEAGVVSRLAGLSEPLGVALGNSAQLVELSRLREAAEANNRLLRTKLQSRGVEESIVGESRGLRSVMERVSQVAPTDAPVLILGETGSGKEMIARAIHERSRRAAGPIVRVNCGAIPAELIDSELFGHEKGSFTGAVATRKGWFERADGGTLFLDEIGELPAAAQVRLLRILQDGLLERVGGARAFPVDVRIVAATHRDLPAMVASGEFRSDLWYRISVFPLRLPAVRERLEDLPDLVSYFGARAGERLGGAPLQARPEDLALLAQYRWPGNVRELAAVIERAAILGHGRRLEIAAALGAVASPVIEVPRIAEKHGDSDVAELDEAMVRHIERALTQTKGRIEGPQGAAAILKVNPHTLRARMRKLGLDWARFRTQETPTQTPTLRLVGQS